MTRDFNRGARDDKRQGYTDRPAQGRFQNNRGGGQGSGQGGGKKRDSIGALWRKTIRSGDHRGDTFYSGELEVSKIMEVVDQKQLKDTDKIAIVVFENTQKREGEKTPDLRILLSEERERDDRGEDRRDDRRDDRSGDRR